MIVVLSLSSGVFEIAEATGVQQGTKIVLHLKDDCKEFSAEDRVKGRAAGATSVAEPITALIKTHESVAACDYKLLYLFQRS